jgi:hypothetical protein
MTRASLSIVGLREDFNLGPVEIGAGRLNATSRERVCVAGYIPSANEFGTIRLI